MVLRVPWLKERHNTKIILNNNKIKLEKSKRLKRDKKPKMKIKHTIKPK